MNFPRIAILVLGIVLLVGTCGAFTCYESPTSPDGTCCLKIYNLDKANTVQISGPVVVDINEETGNLLVRGPLPLVVRNGSGQNGNCMNYPDWRFAYDEFTTMMPERNSVAPVYFTDSKKAALQQDMQDFHLDDYHVVDISFLDHAEINQLEFNTLLREFGGDSSTCNASLVEGTLHGQKANLISSKFVFCNDGIDQACRDSMDNDIGDACSYASRISQIMTLMAEKDASGKPRLIYYHCVLGSDRTGSVTIGYLQKTIPTLSFVHAMNYAMYLGKENQGRDAVWSVNPGANNTAQAYCQMIQGDCTLQEAPRIILPGRDTHSHLPGQEDPVVATPAPTAVPVPVQTPVPTRRYNPTDSGGADF